MTATGRPAGDSRWISSGTPAMRGVSVPAEQLLQLDRQHRLPARIVHADPRPARHLDPLRGHLVQPRGSTAPAGAARRPRRCAPGRPAGGRWTAPAPATGRRGRRRPSMRATAPRARDGRTPAGRVGPRPAWSRQYVLGAQAVQHGLAHVGVGSGVEDSSIAPSRSTTRADTSPRRSPGGIRQAISSSVRHRVRQPGDLLVDHHRLPDPRRRRAGGPVGDRHGQPLRRREPRPLGELRLRCRTPSDSRRPAAGPPARGRRARPPARPRSSSLRPCSVTSGPRSAGTARRSGGGARLVRRRASWRQRAVKASPPRRAERQTSTRSSPVSRGSCSDSRATTSAARGPRSISALARRGVLDLPSAAPADRHHPVAPPP